LTLFFALLATGCSHGDGARPAARAPVAVAQAVTTTGTGDTTVAASADHLLTVVETDGAVKADPADGRFDFGEFDPLDKPKLEHTFTLRNDNAVPIEIAKIHTSCGCTSAVVEGSAPNKYPVTVAPGQTIHIHTTVDMGHVDDGPFSKSVFITLAGHDSPSHKLDLWGNRMGALVLDPQDVDFSQSHVGETPSRTVGLSINRKLLAGGKDPKVTCTVDGVTVTGPLGEENGEMYSRRSYRVTLGKHMRLGAFWGQLEAATDPAVAGASSLRAPGFIHGEIVGDFTVVPNNVTFGSPEVGAPIAEQAVTVRGNVENALRGLTARSLSPLIHVRLAPADPNTPETRQLHLTLRPDAPAGGFHGEVIVGTPSGGEMVVTAQAYIRPKDNGQ
jgi:hypothetical protein